jgi:hypothetical protein
MCKDPNDLSKGARESLWSAKAAREVRDARIYAVVVAVESTAKKIHPSAGRLPWIRGFSSSPTLR